MRLRDRLIRLAHSDPELRPFLLPILKEGRGGAPNYSAKFDVKRSRVVVKGTIPNGADPSLPAQMAPQVLEHSRTLMKFLQGRGFWCSTPPAARISTTCPIRFGDPSPSVFTVFQANGSLTPEEADELMSMGWRIEKDGFHFRGLK